MGQTYFAASGDAGEADWASAAPCSFPFGPHETLAVKKAKITGNKKSDFLMHISSF